MGRFRCCLYAEAVGSEAIPASTSRVPAFIAWGQAFVGRFSFHLCLFIFVFSHFGGHTPTRRQKAAVCMRIQLVEAEAETLFVNAG